MELGKECVVFGELKFNNRLVKLAIWLRRFAWLIRPLAFLETDAQVNHYFGCNWWCLRVLTCDRLFFLHQNLGRVGNKIEHRFEVLKLVNALQLEVLFSLLQLEAA